MVNSNEDKRVAITLGGVQLENMDSFKHLGSVITKDGKSEKEVTTRIGAATSAMARLSRIWRSGEISFNTKIQIIGSLYPSLRM